MTNIKIPNSKKPTPFVEPFSLFRLPDAALSSAARKGHVFLVSTAPVSSLALWSVSIKYRLLIILPHIKSSLFSSLCFLLHNFGQICYFNSDTPVTKISTFGTTVLSLKLLKYTLNQKRNTKGTVTFVWWSKKINFHQWLCHLQKIFSLW